MDSAQINVGRINNCKINLIFAPVSGSVTVYKAEGPPHEPDIIFVDGKPAFRLDHELYSFFDLEGNKNE